MTNEELVEQIQSGIDVKTNMGLLYQQNYGFIYKLALPYSSERIEIEDLLQEAYFGLEKAVLKYDTEQFEASFLTYASYKIKRSIQLYCYNHGLTKRIPVNVLELIHKYHKFRKDFMNEYGEYPSDQDIIKHLNIKRKKLNDLREIINAEYCQSLNAIIPGTDDTTLDERIADEYDMEQDVSNRLSTETVNQSIWNAVKELDERSSEIITGHYKDGLTFESISEIFRLSKERIRQVQNKAFHELKENIDIQAAAEFYGYECNSAYHYGVNRFKNTFTSSTEFLALKRLGLSEQITKKHRCIMR